MEDIATKIKWMIVHHTEGVEIQDIHPESALGELGVDSLSLVEISMEIEDQTEIEVPDEQIVRFNTIQDIIDYVTSNIE